MKCWKCGQGLAEGSGVCVYCGADQNRPAPVTEVGSALRSLYDRYGAKTVLSNGSYLVSGLGDLVDDAKKLRNQLKMAMDAGVGRVYLEQLNSGAPDESFDGRVKRLLTEEAGLSDRAAGEIAGYFDEMIGWRAGPAGKAGAKKRTTSGAGEKERGAKKAEAENHRSKMNRQQTAKQTAGGVAGNGEVDRTGRYTAQKTDASQQNTAPEGGGCLSAIISIAIFALTLVLTVYISPVFTILMIAAFFIGIGNVVRAISNLFKK